MRTLIFLIIIVALQVWHNKKVCKWINEHPMEKSNIPWWVKYI